MMWTLHTNPASGNEGIMAKIDQYINLVQAKLGPNSCWEARLVCILQPPSVQGIGSYLGFKGASMICNSR